LLTRFATSLASRSDRSSRDQFVVTSSHLTIDRSATIHSRRRTG
jgi:hypothetical protein